MDTIFENIKNAFTDYGPRVLAALILLIIGLIVIGFVTRLTRRIMKKRGVDDTLRKFLTNLTGWALRILLFIAVAAKLGVETTSFAAVIAAAGLAVGLALQSSLERCKIALDKAHIEIPFPQRDVHIKDKG